MTSASRLRHSVKARVTLLAVLLFLVSLLVLIGYEAHVLQQPITLQAVLQEHVWVTPVVLSLAVGAVAWWILGRELQPMAQFEQLRSRLLELLVQGAALPVLLEALVQGLRVMRPDLRCAVLALEPGIDAQNATLRVAASIGLPEFFTEALNGLKVEQGNGGCATAAFTGERVVIENVAEHAYWAAYRELAARAHIRACWSEPVLGMGGQIFAVFSLYKDQAQTPPLDDLELIEQVARLTSVAFERHQAAQQMRDSEARFRALAESTPEAILVHRQQRIVYANPAAARMFGAASTKDLLGTSTQDRIHPDFLQQQAQRYHAIVQGQPVEPMVESRFLRLDGTAFDVEVQGTSIMFAEHDAVHVSIRDISQRKQNEQQLRVAANVFSHALEGIVITGPDASIIDVNEAFTRITGYSRAEVLGKNPRLLKSGRQDLAYYQAMWQSLLSQGQWSGELWNRRKDGLVYVQQQNISAVRNAQGEVMQYVALISDITQRKEQEARLAHLAHFDALTGLPNRVLKRDRLSQAMAQALRRELKLALVFLDLDGFKSINDKFSHQAGDHLLMTLAQRMKQVLREGDTLARIGGDEFAAVLVDLNQDSDCEPLLQRLLEAASEPVLFEGDVLQVSASIGVALYPQNQEIGAEKLMHCADMAMYRAKEAGKNRFHVHSESSA